MASIIKLNLGAGFADAFATAVLNSIASGNAILSGTDIANGTNLDVKMDVSLHLASLACVAPNFVGVYLYPLTHGASVYGDGRFSSSAAGPPPSEYWRGNIPLVAATQAQDGIITGIDLLPGTFRLVLWNQAGVAFASSGNTCQYRVYEYQAS